MECSYLTTAGTRGMRGHRTHLQHKFTLLTGRAERRKGTIMSSVGTRAVHREASLGLETAVIPPL